MKLPLRMIDARCGDIKIVDATNRTVMTVLDCPEARKIAQLTVRKFNRWRLLHDAIDYTRDDWMMERNTWRPS